MYVPGDTSGDPPLEFRYYLVLTKNSISECGPKTSFHIAVQKCTLHNILGYFQGRHRWCDWRQNHGLPACGLRAGLHQPGIDFLHGRWEGLRHRSKRVHRMGERNQDGLLCRGDHQVSGKTSQAFKAARLWRQQPFFTCSVLQGSSLSFFVSGIQIFSRFSRYDDLKTHIEFDVIEISHEGLK